MMSKNLYIISGCNGEKTEIIIETTYNKIAEYVK